MKTLTVDQIMALRPCYNREQVEELFGDRQEATLLEILDAEIPAQDRVWVLAQPGVLTPAQRQAFCDLTADRAVRNHCLRCGVSEVEAWAARWLSGEERSEAAAYAARAAAWSAARSAADAARSAVEAAWDAARSAADAARSAAWDAARSAAYAARSAAWYAAWDAAAATTAAAAWSATTAAARAAEREAQVRDLRAILEGGE